MEKNYNRNSRWSMLIRETRAPNPNIICTDFCFDYCIPFFCSNFFIFCVNIQAFPLFKRYLAKHGMLRLCGTNEKEIQMHSCIWKALGLWAWLPIILRMKRRLIISARSQIDYIFFSTKLCLPFTEHTFFFSLELQST